MVSISQTPAAQAHNIFIRFCACSFPSFILCALLRLWISVLSLSPSVRPMGICIQAIITSSLIKPKVGKSVSIQFVCKIVRINLAIFGVESIHQSIEWLDRVTAATVVAVTTFNHKTIARLERGLVGTINSKCYEFRFRLAGPQSVWWEIISAPLRFNRLTMVIGCRQCDIDLVLWLWLND